MSHPRERWTAEELNRREFLRRTAGTAIALPTLAAILDACTKAGDPNPSPVGSGSGSAGATTGTLRVGWSSEPDTLNPLTSFSTEANEVLQLVYDKLNDYDADLNIQPNLAESTTASANGKTVTYALRSGVTWHDGTPFTADDVVFSFERARADSSQLRAYSNASGTPKKIVGGYSVKTRLTTSGAGFSRQRIVVNPLSSGKVKLFPNP
jgi:peptide/nickel transport system substrate-binding protein